MLILYFAMLLCCGSIVAVSFILGEIFGAIGNVFEGIGDSIGDSIGGIFDNENISAIGGDGDGGPEGPSPFSFRIISSFGAGFGAGGLIGKGLEMSDPHSLIPAGSVGLIMAIGMWVFLRVLYTQQGSTSVGQSDYIGSICRVNVSIPGNGRGVIAVDVKGERKNIAAISADGSAIPDQAEVHIVSMEGGIAVVKMTQAKTRQL